MEKLASVKNKQKFLRRFYFTALLKVNKKNVIFIS